MASVSRVQQLLDELGDSGCTPEGVCAACPELLPEVRRRWRQMCAVKADLHALFPTPGSDPGTTADIADRWHSGDEPPQIPGYEVEGLLGRGGMGIVFRARHLRLKRWVALKMSLGGAYAGSREQDCFQREAEVVARLRHPNVVQIYDVRDVDGRVYFTMELVEGGSLAQKLAGVPQPARQAAGLVATLAGAVQAAHDCGIVHRDLKPANVLLTADGTPKISDFGLARRQDDAASLHPCGVQVGTPSYMAPEQARNQPHAIGPAVDVYALGAILYELLTGRPPFRAASAAETMQQVISQEPAPPSRLNDHVPRDLETICLKCLSKEPVRRYATAAALADDLERFQRGEAISARRPGSFERVGKWIGRRPTAAALIGSSVLFTTVLVAGALWLAVEQTQRQNAIEADLRELHQLQRQARWSEAGVALQRAEARLGEGRAGGLRRRLGQARKDLNLVVELDRIHLNRVTSYSGWNHYKSKADHRYTSAFENSGLAKAGEPPDVVAARVSASAVRAALIAALDDWAVCASAKDRRKWLLSVARKADPDPLGWRDRIRDAASRDDVPALVELAETVPVSEQSVSLLLALGERLRDKGDSARPFLKRVQNAHPADFWANISLGDNLYLGAPVEAGSYYRAALASRPEAAVAYTALADSLRIQKRFDEAKAYYRQALEIDPNYARAQTNLGIFLKDAGQLDEAIVCFRKALQLDPNYAWAHLDLAKALRDAGRFDEALEHFRRFHDADQSIPYVENILRSDLVRRGRGEEARREWKKALALGPPEHAAWFGYAELCLFLGDHEEYRRARQDLLRRFGDARDPYVAEPTARAALLAPPSSEEELRTAIALAERAVGAKSTAPEWVYPYFAFALGLAEYRQDHFERAIALMNAEAAKVLGQCPRLVLAMAQHRLGEKEEARTTLAEAISKVDWSMSQVRSHDQWLWHVLRREAEAMIFPNTAAFLEGKYEPRDNTERLALLGVCRFQNRTLASARLYADAFEADATLADDLRLNHRLRAARSAALAGCGQGADAACLEETERKRWRDQAREWLRAELAARVHAFDADPQATRTSVRKALARWREDPELECVRRPGKLDKLTADERQEFLKFWAEVAAVLARMEQ